MSSEDSTLHPSHSWDDGGTTGTRMCVVCMADEDEDDAMMPCEPAQSLRSRPTSARSEADSIIRNGSGLDVLRAMLQGYHALIGEPGYVMSEETLADLRDRMADVAERIARIEAGGRDPSACPLVSLPLFDGGDIDVNPAGVASLVREGGGYCRVGMGHGSALVALSRSQVRDRLWPEVQS